MRTPIAAIYSPVGRDPRYHATMKCRNGGIRITPNGSYRVNTWEFVTDLRLKPCACWKHNGYVPEILPEDRAA